MTVIRRNLYSRHPLLQLSLLLLSTAFVLISNSASYVLAASLSGNRTLILLDDLNQQFQYSIFFKSLEDRGLKLSYSKASDPSLEIFKYVTDRQYDNLLVFSTSTESYGGDTGVATFINFVNDGGNILVAGSSEISETIRDLALEFSADFDERGSAVFDHFHSAEFKNSITADNYLEPSIVGKSVLEGSPVLYRGVAHRVTNRNPLMTVVLAGSPSSYSYELGKDSAIEGSPIVGQSVALVSALQARNNARVVFSGSLDIFSNEFIEAQVKGKKSGNLNFVTELSKWAFQEKNVLKFAGAKHHRANETDQHGIYRIKDDLEYELIVSEYHSDAWHPFVVNDIQLEAVMLDPYIRQALVLVSSTSNSTLYKTRFTLPDRYGVFTFKVDYKRKGYSWMLASDVVEIRPYRHTDYPRFLTVAYPYYANSFSMMVGFVLFSALWLYNKDPGNKSKSKTS